MLKDSVELISYNVKRAAMKHEFLSVMALKYIKANQTAKALQQVSDLKFLYNELIKYLEANLEPQDAELLDNIANLPQEDLPVHLQDLFNIKKMQTILSVELNSLTALSKIEIFNVCKLAVALYPKNTKAYFNLYDYFYDNNKILEAKEVCSILLEKEPDNEEVHRRLGDIYNFKLNDWENAVKEYEFYKSRRPDNKALNKCLQELYNKLDI